MDKLTADALAAMLDGRQMGQEITKAEEDVASEAGLVVVFGYSDDNVEMRGAINDEVSAYNGTTVSLGGSRGVLTNDCDDERCPYYLRALEQAPCFKARWCAIGEAAWSFSVPWPHATFRVLEDDEVFCVGVVFALAEVPRG